MNKSGELRSPPGSEAPRGLVARSQFEQLFALAPEALLVTDAKGQLVKWNEAAELMFGHDEKTMPSLRMEDFLPESQRQALAVHQNPASEAAASRDMSPRGTFKAQRRDGATFDAEVSVGPIDFDGQPCVIAIVRNQTEMVLARERAEAAKLAKNTFLANMSHEIRTPMNAIMGLTQLMLLEHPTDQQRDRLGLVMTAAKHLLGIVDDVLDLSKIEAGKLALHPVDFKLEAVLEAACGVLADSVRNKGLRLERHIDPDVPTLLQGDPQRLQQILINYGTNAAKFTANGHVKLRVKLDEQSPSWVVLRFEVEDTGMGVAPEQLHRLFNPFEQVDDSMTRRHGGTGLGLSISRHLARLMGGKVGCSSEPGLGSVFWFTARLKRAEASAELSMEDVPANQADLKLRCEGARVLLVEDQALGRLVAHDMLQYIAGIEADTASDGLEAVERAKGQSYDLIFMDMQMPNMNGMDASRLIRALPAHAATPIIGLTANAFSEDRQRCLDAGMNEHMAKPLSVESMTAVLTRWLTSRSY
ncbi:ATP-binding protein [Aquabacterium sp.]|uniref:ATP-binding protein n=1 Tax=Aquabacterium sp. TaxID=1872578 RepID=UPI003D6D434B